MQATIYQATPLADNNNQPEATPLAYNRATSLADNLAMLLAENNSQAARAAETHMATLLAVYTAQNNTNAQSAAELEGAQSEAFNATWGTRATPQQTPNGARNLSGSFSAASTEGMSAGKLSTRTQMDVWQTITEGIQRIAREKEELERKKAEITVNEKIEKPNTRKKR